MNNLTSFEHQILIAMPSLDNSWFEKTVIYLVEDNAYGSMGLVINLNHKLNISELLQYLKFESSINEEIGSKHVLMGGPMSIEHGFILFNGKPTWQRSMSLKDKLSMSVSDDLLHAIGQNKGPEKFIACLGFAGWEVGQLAQEINENSWLTIPYNEDLLFDVEPENKWRVALNTLGVSPEFLSMEAGHDC